VHSFDDTIIAHKTMQWSAMFLPGRKIILPQLWKNSKTFLIKIVSFLMVFVLFFMQLERFCIVFARFCNVCISGYPHSYAVYSLFSGGFGAL
jgi:hypothetical protein